MHRIAFFGTPEFAVPSLRELLRGPDAVVGVVCQPDRPAGRGQHLTVPPVKSVAIEAGLPILQPDKIRDDAFLAALRSWAPDLAVVVAYGRILPRSILDLPRLGCVNVHASLLPLYRGAAPIQWAVHNGDTVTGVTIMRINERMDAGDILLQRETPIGKQETYGELQTRLAHLGAAALREALAPLMAGTLIGQPQDEARATHAPMIRKEQGLVDWRHSAQEISNAARAFHPWPTAFTFLAGKRLQLHRVAAVERVPRRSPGVVEAVDGSVEVACGNGVLAILELQAEGRKRMPAIEFVRGGHLQPGIALG